MIRSVRSNIDYIFFLSVVESTFRFLGLHIASRELEVGRGKWYMVM